MEITAELSLYPLASDHPIAEIVELINDLRADPRVRVVVNQMSTQISGELDDVMAVVTDAMRKSFGAGGTQVLVAKFLSRGLPSAEAPVLVTSCERAVSALEIAAVVFAVLYLLLVIRENIWCWPAALVGTLLSLVVFADAKLYMESALQLFYAAMAIYGWQQWVRGGDRNAGVAICVWSWRRHAVAIAGILAGTAAFGAVLESRTDAALPYVDSFTTVAALVTTYMVAKKVLENWIYWFVIDAVS